jgi:hypothetical protein
MSELNIIVVAIETASPKSQILAHFNLKLPPADFYHLVRHSRCQNNEYRPRIFAHAKYSYKRRTWEEIIVSL